MDLERVSKNPAYPYLTSAGLYVEQFQSGGVKWKHLEGIQRFPLTAVCRHDRGNKGLPCRRFVYYPAYLGDGKKRWLPDRDPILFSYGHTSPLDFKVIKKPEVTRSTDSDVGKACIDGSL